MIKIGILGDIGSGKSFVAKSFNYPVFNADNEVGKLYKKNRKIFIKLNKALPKYIIHFPIKKQEILRSILANKNNLRKIIKIIHPEVRKKMNIFVKKNKRKNFDYKIINKFRKIQLPLDYKKKKSNFIIKNNFTNRFIKKQIKYILKQIY